MIVISVIVDHLDDFKRTRPFVGEKNPFRCGNGKLGVVFRISDEFAFCHQTETPAVKWLMNETVILIKTS